MWGVLIVLRPGVRTFHLGHICAIVAALANASSVVAYRLAGAGSARLSLFGSCLFGPLIGDGLLMITHASWRIWGVLFGYGFLAALGQLFMMMATAVAPANRVALPQYSQMVWAMAFSYLLFKQPLNNWTFVGIVIVTFSGMLNWIRQKLRFERMALEEHWAHRYRRQADATKS